MGYDFLRIEARGQGHSDLKQYATFQYLNMYPQYEISMILNLGKKAFGPSKFGKLDAVEKNWTAILNGLKTI